MGRTEDARLLDRTERVAWRYSGGDIDLIELQAVGQYAEQTGCPPLSLSLIVACYPRFLPREPYLPEKNGRMRPRNWHCDFRVFLTKRLSQPWFAPFSEPRDRRTLPSFRLHRDALKRLIDPEVHDRADIWYMRDDGSNVEENCRDITAVALDEGLAFLDRVHDPKQALALVDDGSLLTNPVSPRATELRQHIRTYGLN